MLRWRCLEVGCGTAVEAGSEEELVEAANTHVRDAHDSYELEEVILAGAEPMTPGHARAGPMTPGQADAGEPIDGSKR